MLVLTLSALSLPPPQVEVVVAHYDEATDWLDTLPRHVTTTIYHKGSEAKRPKGPSVPLKNVGRESHTYLSHIVSRYDTLADWTVFTQGGMPSFGYGGHRLGGGHLAAAKRFDDYLVPREDAYFVYTGAVLLDANVSAPRNFHHVLRADYCMAMDEAMGDTCPADASAWTQWWDVGWFREFLLRKMETQHGPTPLEYYDRYVSRSTQSSERRIVAFSQGARFGLSRDTIRRRPKAEYEALLRTVSNDPDPIAGYYLEWFWSDVFLDAPPVCPLPEYKEGHGVTHAGAMQDLEVRFGHRRMLGGVSGGGVSGGGVSGGGVSGGGVSGGPAVTGPWPPPPSSPPRPSPPPPSPPPPSPSPPPPSPSPPDPFPPSPPPSNPPSSPPSPPGITIVHRVQVGFVVAGTVETFDAPAFRTSLRRLFPDASEVVISVRPASVAVDVTLVYEGEDKASGAVSMLKTATPEALSEYLGVSVESSTVPTLTQIVHDANQWAWMSLVVLLLPLCGILRCVFRTKRDPDPVLVHKEETSSHADHDEDPEEQMAMVDDDESEHESVHDEASRLTPEEDGKERPAERI